MPNTLKILPKWQNFAKFGHAGLGCKTAKKAKHVSSQISSEICSKDQCRKTFLPWADPMKIILAYIWATLVLNNPIGCWKFFKPIRMLKTSVAKFSKKGLGPSLLQHWGMNWFCSLSNFRHFTKRTEILCSLVSLHDSI